MIGRPADESSLSRKPSQVRNRLRRAAKRGDEAVLKRELEYYEEGMRKPIHEWDLEELAHGKPRNKNGGFGGRTPSWITESVSREIKRQLHKRTFGKLASNAELAVKVVTKLMESEEVDDKGRPIVDARTQLAAATFVIEHVIGKPKEVIEYDPTDQARQMFAAAIVLDDGKPQGHLPPVVIEGEIVEMEDEEL